MRPLPQGQEERLPGHQEQLTGRPRRCRQDARQRGGETRHRVLRHAGNAEKQRRGKDPLADGLHLHAHECRPLRRGKHPAIRRDVP